MGGSGFSSQLSLLRGNLLGAGFAHLFLSGERLGAGLLCSGGNLAGLLRNLALLIVEPGFEFLVGLLLGEGALLDAVQEVVMVHHTLVLEDGTGGVRHLSTDLQPVEGAVVHHVDGGRVGVGVVGADLLDETTVPLGAGIGGDDVVKGLALLTVTLEAEACGHLKNVLKGSETLLLILKNGPRR